MHKEFFREPEFEVPGLIVGVFTWESVMTKGEEVLEYEEGGRLKEPSGECIRLDILLGTEPETKLLGFRSTGIYLFLSSHKTSTNIDVKRPQS